MHLLPNDNSISKLQVQKAATPVEGLHSTEDVGRAIAAQRPNAVVLEKSGNDEGDIQERKTHALRKIV